MKVLAFDSTAPILSVGIANSGDILGRWDARADRTRGGTLDELINRALDESELTRERIDGLALVTGPGSLTALRIGWATASGWALTRGIPVIGWPVAAVQHRRLAAQVSGTRDDSGRANSKGAFCLVHHRGAEFYLYDLSRDDVKSEPTVTTREELGSLVGTGDRIVGPGLLHDYDAWLRTLPDGVEAAPECEAIVGGDQLAVWGNHDLLAGRKLDLRESPLDYGLPPMFRKAR